MVWFLVMSVTGNEGIVFSSVSFFVYMLVFLVTSLVSRARVLWPK